MAACLNGKILWGRANFCKYSPLHQGSIVLKMIFQFRILMLTHYQSHYQHTSQEQPSKMGIDTTFLWEYGSCLVGIRRVSFVYLAINCTCAAYYVCVSSVSRTTTRLFATWTQRECVTDSRFPSAGLPSSCTTAWPNSWLTLYRGLFRAMRPTAFWRGTTPRTLRRRSEIALRETWCSENTPCSYSEEQGFLVEGCSFFSPWAVAQQYFLRIKTIPSFNGF